MSSDSNLDIIEYERLGDVGVWRISDFAELVESGELEAGEEHYRGEAADPSMDATVVVINNAGGLGRDLDETLDHVNEQWSALADEVGVDRIAYVAEGIISWTVQSKVEGDVETSSFETVEKALDWVRQ